MKKLIICTFVLASLTLCSCGGGPSRRRSNSSSSGSGSSQQGSFDNVEKDLSYDEFKNIVINAAHVERDRMSSIVYLDGDGAFVNTGSSIERFNDNYYHYHMEADGYDSQDIYAYSTPDWEHNYYRYKDSNGVLSDVYDYVTEEANDQYIYAFGYGQIGFHPASFVACYGGMIFDSGVMTTVSFTYMHQSDNVIEFTMSNYAGVEGMDLMGKMTLNLFGGCDTFTFTMTNNQALPGTISAKTIFDNRNDPPREIVDMFMIYN